jgi:hypothetical protein
MNIQFEKYKCFNSVNKKSVKVDIKYKINNINVII